MPDTLCTRPHGRGDDHDQSVAVFIGVSDYLMPKSYCLSAALLAMSKYKSVAIVKDDLLGRV